MVRALAAQVRGPGFDSWWLLSGESTGSSSQGSWVRFLVAASCYFSYSPHIVFIFFPQSRQNEYGRLVEGSVLRILLEAGVPTLLRYALDDSADTVMAATILCLHGLLVVPVEEVCVCVCVCVCVVCVCVCVVCVCVCVCVCAHQQKPSTTLPLLYQYLMDKYCYCFHGNTLPALRSHDQSHDSRKKEQEEEKESDAEVIQRDVVEVCQ